MSDYTVVIRPDETGAGSNLIELTVASTKQEFLYGPSLPDDEEDFEEEGSGESVLLYHMVEYIAHLERQLAVKTQRCRHLDVVIKHLSDTECFQKTPAGDAYSKLPPVDMETEERLIARRCAQALKPFIHDSANSVQELQEKISVTAQAFHEKGREKVNLLHTSSDMT